MLEDSPATTAASGDLSPLLANLLLFARLLRTLGLPVSAVQIGELAAALGDVPLDHAEDVRAIARCLLVQRRGDLAIFEVAWAAFWDERLLPGDDPLRSVLNNVQRGQQQEEPERDKQGSSPSPSSTPKQRELEVSRSPSRDEDEDDRESEDEEAPHITIYSRQEALRSKDFALLNEEELTDAQRFLHDMRWTVTYRRTRRTRSTSSGAQPDMRRSLRRSLSHGGEMLSLAYRGPKYKRRQLVLLCDISGSMEQYTRLLLHFLHAVESSVQQTEVFVFGTRLTRITRELRGRDPDLALRAAAAHVQDWSGGTRIGDALRTFNRHWSRRVLEHGAVVLIISDGWDRGDPALLAAEMARLQRQSYRLLWLNPLLGAEGYQPVTQGIVAALPYVDDFLPVHNLHSLEALGQLLSQIQDGRPDRRQGHQHTEGTP